MDAERWLCKWTRGLAFATQSCLFHLYPRNPPDARGLEPPGSPLIAGQGEWTFTLARSALFFVFLFVAGEERGWALGATGLWQAAGQASIQGSWQLVWVGWGWMRKVTHVQGQCVLQDSGGKYPCHTPVPECQPASCVYHLLRPSWPIPTFCFPLYLSSLISPFSQSSFPGPHVPFWTIPVALALHELSDSDPRLTPVLSQTRTIPVPLASVAVDSSILVVLSWWSSSRYPR